jgi:hypothetical protein
MAFEIKKNDLRPYWRVTLTQTDPNNPANQIPVNLTGATSVSFMMKPALGALKVNKAVMTIVDAANGIVEYHWATGDTDTSGTFQGEVEVLWGTAPQSFPSNGYFAITINDDLG